MKWLIAVGTLAIVLSVAIATRTGADTPQPRQGVVDPSYCEYWEEKAQKYVTCPQNHALSGEPISTAGGSMFWSPPCTSTTKGLKWYRGHYVGWMSRMGREVRIKFQKAKSCANAAYLAKRWRTKARGARRSYARWHHYHYAWRSWLPRVWYRIGSCETGYGGDPNWHHNSGNASGTSGYQGAFGFHHGSWDDFRPPGYPSEAFLATPRQQLIVAQRIEARYGLDEPWGCYP